MNDRETANPPGADFNKTGAFYESTGFAIRHLAITIAVLALVLAGGCAHRPAAPAAAERDTVEQRQGEFLAALSARDLDGVTARFADDGVLHVANMPPVQGRGAIRRFYENVFQFLGASEATPETMHISRSADMAYGTGRVSNVFQGEQGPVEYAGKFLLVWEKREGEWLIAVYSVSSNRAGAGR